MVRKEEADVPQLVISAERFAEVSFTCTYLLPVP